MYYKVFFRTITEILVAEPEEILELAEILNRAAVIEVHSGDREPGSHLNEDGRKWVVEGLKLLAEKRKISSYAAKKETKE